LRTPPPIFRFTIRELLLVTVVNDKFASLCVSFDTTVAYYAAIR